MPTLEIKSLYDDDVYHEIIDRLNKINADSKPIWGKMGASQMLAHCAEVQAVMSGKPLQKIPWYMKMFSVYIKKMITNRKPYKKNLPTAPDYIIADERDFDKEKARFTAALEKFRAQQLNPPDHPLFGKLTEHERGWGMYKHVDHHLRQFGA